MHELNQLELQFLLLNDFSLMIPLDEMQHYADQLLYYGGSPAAVTTAAAASAAVEAGQAMQTAPAPGAAATAGAASVTAAGTLDATARVTHDGHGDVPMHSG